MLKEWPILLFERSILVRGFFHKKAFDYWISAEKSPY